MESKPKIRLNLVLGSLLFVTTVMMIGSFQLLHDEKVAHEEIKTKLTNTIEERDTTIESLLSDTTSDND